MPRPVGQDRGAPGWHYWRQANNDVGVSGEVFVPKTAALLSKSTGALPGRLRDALFRLAGGEKVTNTIDETARAEYRRRVAGPERNGEVR